MLNNRFRARLLAAGSILALPLLGTVVLPGGMLGWVTPAAGADEPKVNAAARANEPAPQNADARVVAAASVVAPAAKIEGRIEAPDPFDLARRGLERYQREVREYRCTFLKQERLPGGLTPVQEIDVLFREKPHSVYMYWKKNPDKVKRALYIDDPSFFKDGQRCGRVEPAGAIARLFVSDLLVPVAGKDAQEASRRPINEFGFRSTLELWLNYNTAAREAGVLDIKYVGPGTIDNRPTHVFTRRLPYTGPNGQFPDARCDVHLDQEWLLPVAVYSYADADGKVLLGSYVMVNVKLNPRFGPDTFKF